MLRISTALPRLFTRTLGTSVARSTRPPHLIMFVDVNGTIIAGDSARNKSRANSIQQMLAEWKGVWDPAITTEEMSYYDFTNKHLIRASNAEERSSQRDYYFANFLERLKQSNHPLYRKASTTFNKANEILKAEEGEVFPAFIRMIKELEKRKQPYSIIFRSYGTDTDLALKEIEIKTGIKFKQYLHFEEHHLKIGDHSLKTPEQMLAIIKPGEHGAWDDDYEYWDTHGRRYEHAKLYPLNSNDLENTLTIFFDDNTCDKQIIKVCDLANADETQEEAQRRLLEQGRLVHLETLDAILDPDHFIKYVDSALKFRQQCLMGSSISLMHRKQPTS